MATETSKAAPRRAAMEIFRRAFTGLGIDIGAGPDPLRKEMGFPGIEDVEIFDAEHGDANRIDELRTLGTYDFVYASQCLEHMRHPWDCLPRWGKLVREGGYLVFSVPDWWLYEGGHWPSLHNPDHKSTWTIGANATAPDVNVDVCELCRMMQGHGFRTMLIAIADTNYNYAHAGTDLDQTMSYNAEAFIEVILWKTPKALSS